MNGRREDWMRLATCSIWPEGLAFVVESLHEQVIEVS